MSTLTSKFLLKKPAPGDAVAATDELLRETFDRIDYLMGETFDNTITPSAANVKTTKTIAFGRTYSSAPRCLVCLGRDGFVNNITAGVATIWIDDVTTTDVTIGINANNTTVREFTLWIRPKQGDATI